MAKTVTATEAKNRLGALFKELNATDEPIFIENRGKEQAVLISTKLYRDFLILKYEQRRAQAIAKIEEIEQAVAARGDGLDLDEEEALEFSVQLVREIRAERALERLRAENDERRD